MLSALRTFQSGRDPSQWDAANVNPLPDPTSATSAAAEGKVPQPSAAISRPPYQLRSPNKWTQADQDRLDEEVRQQARESLTQSWKDKLSVISLITTFFVATEAQLLSATVSGNGGTTSNLGSAANAGLTGALVIHSFAAIISFLAAFFLISHTIHEARLELKLDLDRTDSYNSLSSQHQHHAHQRERSVMKSDARIVNVCRFDPTVPPVRLLERCNCLCMFLTALGFTLEVMAILCFAWDRMGVVVSSFASGLTLFCLVASAVVMRPGSPRNLIP